MYGLISAKGQVAALCSGNQATLYDINGQLLGEKSLAAVSALFQNFGDVSTYSNFHLSDLIKTLRVENKKQKAISLLLTVLDNDIDELDKCEIFGFLEELLLDKKIIDYLNCCMYAAPLPEAIFLSEEICKKIEKFPSLCTFLQNLLYGQPKISSAYSSWVINVSNRIPDSYKGIANGVYASSGFAYSYANGMEEREISTIKFKFYDKLKHVPDHRVVIANFFKHLNVVAVPASKGRAIQPESEMFEVDEYKKQKDSSQKLYAQVSSQLETIKGLFKNNEIDRAMGFTNSLIVQQVKSGYPEYAAKSLGALAEYAKSLCMYKLMIKLAFRSTEVCPSDERAWAQLGDAYLLDDDFEGARAVYEKCANLSGLRGYSFAGFARIHRAKHDYETALQFIERAWECDEDPVHGAIRAEILADLGRFDEAEKLYRELVEVSPDNVAIKCGLAATLAEQNRYAEAQDIYYEAIKLWPVDQVPYTSLGFLLAKQGQFKAAFKYLDDGIKFSKSGDFVPVHAKATALRMAGKYNVAEDMLRDMIEKYPNNAELKFGLLEIFIARGELKYALELCDSYLMAASERDADSLLRVQANIFRKMGMLTDSLRIIDSLCQKHPKWLLALCDKGDVLRGMGAIEPARNIYHSILAVHKDYRRAVNGLRLLDALSSINSLSIESVTKSDPVTVEDWEDINLEGLVLLSKRNYKGAQKLLQTCKRSPFKVIEDASVVPEYTAQVGLGHYKKVLTKINALSSDDAKIQRIIIYCQLGNMIKAKALINTENLSGELVAHVLPLIEKFYFSSATASNDAFYNVIDEHVKCMLRAA